MRKLLILMLVLGMASLAHAGLTITVGAQGAGVDVGDTYTMSPTDYIWIGIEAQGVVPDPPKQWHAYLSIADPCTMPGSWTLGNNTYSPPAIAAAYNTYFGPNPYYGDTWYANNTDGVPSNIAGDGLSADFEFHCDGLGLVVIDLVDAASGLVIDTLSITQIPEPITIALLGLGGLFLRRRK